MIKKKVTIIGTGSLGSVLAKALHEKEIEIFSLFNRSSRSLLELSKLIKPTYTGQFPKSINQLGDIVFITIPDQSIALVASKLSELGSNFSNKVIAHSSGTKPSSVLSVLQQKRASVAAFHPIQTFSAQSDPEDFKNIYFDIEGDKKAKKILKKIAGKLKAHYFEVSAEAKPYLHAAGVMTSNYLLALLSLAGSVSEMGGVDRQKATQVLLPLAVKTVENAQLAEKLSYALSGPIVRGDNETVEKHLTLLREDQNVHNLYQALGEETLKLAERRDQLTTQELRQLKSLLNKDM